MYSQDQLWNGSGGVIVQVRIYTGKHISTLNTILETQGVTETVAQVQKKETM